MTDLELLDDETAALRAWHRDVLEDHDDRFEAAKELVRRLGGHWRDGHAEFGFWTPELLDRDVPADEVYLELLTPREDLDPGGPPDEATFDRTLVGTRREGEFTWAAVAGGHLRPGTREQFGTCYQLVYEHEGERRTITDPLAHSLPFGTHAPPELYDVERLHRERPDREYYAALGTDDEPVPTSEDDGLPRIDPATSMVEIHPGTATGSGSLAGLARRFEGVAERVAAGDPEPADEHFLGYDAVQLMPVEPITENEDHPGYWRRQSGDGTAATGSGDGDPSADTLTVELDRPDMRNWGYDIVVHGFSAVNPAILETGRPDELVEFIAACHAMPDPVRVVFDVALGHADNGALDLLNDYYFSGPGMYGQELDYTQPVVRAVLLEMQRRKMDFGADGIRIDGAQDFTNWDPERGEWHDDAFLEEMDRVVQEVAGNRYRPWMIYEDGRPWPREDWELASTYHELIDQHPHSFQWSPITFAHNTPAMLTFWATKWWRVFEVADFGSHWVTGVANHDTLRRGSQRDVQEGWQDDPVNPYLGETTQDTIDAAYDNPATDMLMHCVLPGVPMDFLTANHRAPWGFVRDTDAPWNVKVVAEEHNVAEWQIRERDWADDRFFSRLKGLGFDSRDELAEFVHTLADAVEATEFDLDRVAAMLSVLDVPLGGDDLTTAELQTFGYAWMRDVWEFANLDRWRDDQDPERARFGRRVREFRQDRPWLREDVDHEGAEAFDYRHPANGAVVYYGLRRAPDGSEELLFVGNMEGQATTVTPTDLVDVTGEGWEVALAPPDLDVPGADVPLALANAEAVVFSRTPE